MPVSGRETGQIANNSNQETIHPLVEPRILAAIAVVALGCSIGFGLMLAKLFVAFGAVLSLASAVSVLWIYWRHFKLAYSSIRLRTVYIGISITELIVAVIVIIVVIVLAAAIYIVESQEGPIVNRAIMEFGGATFDIITPEGLYPVKAGFANAGTLIATGVDGFAAALLTDKKLDQTTISQILDYFANILSAAEKPPLSLGGLEIDIGKGMFATALRADFIKSAADLDPNKLEEHVFLVDRATRQAIEVGTRTLYIFYVLIWEDGAIPGSWQIKGCSIYDGRQIEYVRYCYETHIEAIHRSRRS
jgi:hypothetical protein